MPTGSLPRIIQLQDGSYATPDGKGGWAPYTGQLPDGTTAGAANNPNDFKVGDADEISHTWDLIDSISAARQLAHKPLATGMPAQAITSVPVVGGLVGQNRANLQVKLGSIAGALRQMGIKSLYQGTGQKGVGSIARNQSEQQALQSSLAPLGYVDQGGHIVAGPSPDENTLDQGLTTAQNLFLRHQARMLGMNPDDPNTMSALMSAAADPSKRQLLLNSLKTSGTAAPAANAGAAVPPAALETSTTNQAHLNPAVAKIAPQLTKMLDAPKWRVPDAQILDFVRQNGIDPDSWKELQDALPNRGKAQFSVNPYFNEPLTGAKKLMSQVGTFAPGGIPIGPTAVAAGDTYLLGAAPDIAGTVHAVTGLGPTRDDVMQAKEASAAENPTAAFIGNALGIAANPLARGGGIGRTALLSGLYSGLGSEDPSVGSRLTNAAIGASVGALTHGVLSGAGRGAQAGFRALKGIVAPILGNGDQVATSAALERAAAAMPQQDVPAATAALSDMKATGVAAPAAAALSRSGQEFLSKVASSSPAARATTDAVVGAFRKSVPPALEHDFNEAIAAATPDGSGAAAFLNRPVRDISTDVQNMAGREYETGIAPIKNDQVPVDESLADTLNHEQIKPAIADVLRNSKLSTETQAVLRSLPQWIKDGMVTKMPITVDALRNLATNLDMRAAKSGNYIAGDLAAALRDKIGETFPEYQPVNALYASRMRAIDAMHAARENFLGESPAQIDALAKAGEKFTDAPNPPEFKGVPEKTFYHGARGPIGGLSEGYYNPNNIYGGQDTFYTTDAYNIAAGYGRKNPASQVYQVQEKTPVKMFDMEAPITADRVDQLFHNDNLAGLAFENLVGEGNKTPNLREVMDEMRRSSSGEGISKDEVQEIWSTAQYNLQQEGYGGMTHTGGLLTGKAPHQVKIYFDAPNQLALHPAEVPGPPDTTNLPSNRQFAIAGAREAATNKAGAGTGTNGASLLRQIAEGANQGQRNSMVLGPSAPNVAARAGARATVADTMDRIASGGNTDQTAKFWHLAKYAITTKLTGGAAHYAVARTLSDMPGMSGEDAARVVRVYMDADSADQALKSLSKYYGAARARTIMARVAAVATAGAATRQPPRNPAPNPNVIGAPVVGGN